MSLPGIDCSRWNGMANLAGQAFQFARATYGTARDDKYTAHTANARLQGAVAGAYHFATSGSVAAQVDAFLAAAKLTGVKLLALDLEFNGQNTMTNDHAAQFIQAVHGHGYKIGLYHSRSGFPHLGQDWNWMADWDATSFPPGALFWQHQGNPIDRDLFDGTLAQLRALAGLTPPPVHHVSIQPLPGQALRSFNLFNPDGAHSLPQYGATDVARTGGFTALCSEPTRFLWPGHPAQMLVRILDGKKARGRWVRAAWMED
jgi:hypothetical protein